MEEFEDELGKASVRLENQVEEQEQGPERYQQIVDMEEELENVQEQHRRMIKGLRDEAEKWN